MSCFIKVTRTTMPWPMGWSYFQVQTKDPQLEASSPLQHHGSWSDGLLQLTPEADEDSSLLVGGWDLPEEGHCCPHVGHAVQDRGGCGTMAGLAMPGPACCSAPPAAKGPGSSSARTSFRARLGLGSPRPGEASSAAAAAPGPGPACSSTSAAPPSCWAQDLRLAPPGALVL